MNEVSAFAVVALPRGIESGDLGALVDQLTARVHAVVPPKGRKSSPANAVLPPGLTPLAALPDGMGASWVRLTHRRDALRKAEHARDAPPPAAPPIDERTQANDASDEVWRAFEGWLAGWTRLEDDAAPGAAESAGLHGVLFPPTEGLRFIGWRPRKQWDAMEKRMQILAAAPHRALIEGLGGARFVAHLRATHARFGEVYGFTHATPEAPEATTDARPQWLAAQDALRDFVRKVAAYADPDVAESEALAGWLLGPYVAMVNEFAARPQPKKKPTPTTEPAKPA